MNRAFRFAGASIGLVVVALQGFAFTEQELVDKGRGMVYASLCEAIDDLTELDQYPVEWISWEKDGFFNHFVTNGWTRAMCETAFDKYVAWVSTNDMSTFDMHERYVARGAIGQCIDMGYTNALASIRTYALNPTALSRGTAISTAVEFGGVDEAAASFIETIVTNEPPFSYKDMRFAIWHYCDKLLEVSTNDAGAVSVRDRGARLFYSKRLDWQCADRLDTLFSRAFPGYSESSNRLEYAQHVLSWTTNSDWRAMHDHFVAITNELLSSGQPLGVITVGAP